MPQRVAIKLNKFILIWKLKTHNNILSKLICSREASLLFKLLSEMNNKKMKERSSSNLVHIMSHLLMTFDIQPNNEIPDIKNLYNGDLNAKLLLEMFYFLH